MSALATGQWTSDAVAEWHDLVRNRSGLSFDPSRVGKLLEGVEDRMTVCGVETLAEYRHRVLIDPAEFAALVSLLTVNETYFFRGMEELRLFADQLCPEFFYEMWRARREVRPISIVSAGCSSGEEPYSIAMTLLESQGNSIPFLVYGGDVDGQALAIARAGLYGENAFRSVDETLRTRYFDRELPGRERIAPHIQEKVHFFSFNLIAPEYPPCLQGVDFIFYRNVSIYFDEETKKTIFSRLMEHMAPGGCLFLSPAEIFFHNQPEVRPRGVRLEDRQGRFFFRKQRLSAPVAQGASVWNRGERLSAEGSLVGQGGVEPLSLEAAPFRVGGEEGERERKRGEQKKGLAKVIRLAQSGRYEKALSHLDLYLQEDPAHPQAAVLKAAILLHGGDDRTAVATAQALCRGVLAGDSLSFEALILLAMALHREGVAPLERMDHLKAAIFLRPSSWLPHFYLAQTCELLDEMEMAIREYQVVMYQLAQEEGFPNHGLPFLPLSFSAEQLIHICRLRLQQLHPS